MDPPDSLSLVGKPSFGSDRMDFSDGFPRTLRMHLL